MEAVPASYLFSVRHQLQTESVGFQLGTSQKPGRAHPIPALERTRTRPGPETCPSVVRGSLYQRPVVQLRLLCETSLAPGFTAMKDKSQLPRLSHRVLRTVDVRISGVGDDRPHSHYPWSPEGLSNMSKVTQLVAELQVL